jgi:hypothetical protein
VLPPPPYTWLITTEVEIALAEPVSAKIVPAAAAAQPSAFKTCLKRMCPPPSDSPLNRNAD